MTSLTRSGIVLGLGLGGFVDGIVLHQILGWHHLVCTTATCQVETVEALKRQNTQDGFFHAAVWVLTVVGVALLFRAKQSPAATREGPVLVGGMLAGWGWFNLVEGLIDHQLLQLHHVLPGSPHEGLADILFLASGLALIVAGTMLPRRVRGPSVVTT